MRFFHLSDLHLGIKLYEHDLLKDQKAILDEIVALTRQYQPDAVVFAGDIYDRSVPPVEAVALFDDFMTQLRAALPNGEIMLISGNHDSAQRLDVFRSELSDRGIHMIGNPPMQKGETIERVTLTDDFGAVNFYLLPFVRPGMVRLVAGTKENGDNLSYPEAFSRLLALSPLNPNERNVLVSHQFFLPDGGDAENIDHFTFRRSSDARIDLWELSDLSGVWQNALGETLVIDADRMAYLSYTRLSMGSGTIGDDQDGKGPYLAMNGRIYLSPGLDKDRFTLLGQDADGSFSGVFYPYGQAAAYTGLPGASFETDEDGYCRWYSDGHDAFYITGSYTLAEDGLAYRDDGPVYAAGFDPIPYDPAEDWGDSWMSNWG